MALLIKMLEIFLLLFLLFFLFAMIRIDIVSEQCLNNEKIEWNNAE